MNLNLTRKQMLTVRSYISDAIDTTKDTRLREDCKRILRRIDRTLILNQDKSERVEEGQGT